MKKICTLLFATSFSSLFSQTQIQNGGFELWDNPTSATAEPQQFNSNRTGSSVAQIGPQTCFRDASVFHSGSYSVRVESIFYFTTVVNGNVTTGVVNAPNTNKADGYIGTINYSTPTDIRRMTFTGRPDSLIGFYRYTQGGAAEKAKVVAYLHVGNYFDPETATAFHPDSSVNKIATALFVSPTSNAANWTRFAVPFNYFDSRTPQYIMISITSSNDQLTTVAGSKLWLDDLSVVYNPSTNVGAEDFNNLSVFYSTNNLYLNFSQKPISPSTLEIFDLTGKKITTKNISSEQSTIITFSELSKGMYLYHLDGNTISKSGKFIIE